MAPGTAPPALEVPVPAHCCLLRAYPPCVVWHRVRAGAAARRSAWAAAAWRLVVAAAAWCCWCWRRRPMTAAAAHCMTFSARGCGMGLALGASGCGLALSAGGCCFVPGGLRAWRRVLCVALGQCGPKASCGVLNLLPQLLLCGVCNYAMVYPCTPDRHSADSALLSHAQAHVEHTYPGVFQLGSYHHKPKHAAGIYRRWYCTRCFGLDKSGGAPAWLAWTGLCSHTRSHTWVCLRWHHPQCLTDCGPKHTPFEQTLRSRFVQLKKRSKQTVLHAPPSSHFTVHDHTTSSRAKKPPEVPLYNQLQSETNVVTRSNSDRSQQ